MSVDGVCLTVCEYSHDWARFDVMFESLRVTTLASIGAGSEVNVERAAKDGAEIGGHPLSGHIDFSASIIRVDRDQSNAKITFSVPPEFRRYIFAKGYVAINGCSLTISESNREDGWFNIWLIPETRRVTTFDSKSANDFVNIEIDRGTQVAVDTIRETVQEALGGLNSFFQAALADRGLAIEDFISSDIAKPLSITLQAGRSSNENPR